MNPFNELRDLIRELRELLYHFFRRRLFVGVLINQECVMSNPATIQLGKPAQAAATVTDVNGNAVDNASIVWTSSDESVLTVDSTGALTLVAEGTASVTASAQTASASGRGECVCTVIHAPPGVLTVTVDVTQ